MFGSGLERKVNRWVSSVDHEEEWRRGLGYLGRVRSIVFTAIVESVGFGALWKLVDGTVAAIFFVAAVLSVVGMLSWRRFQRRHFELGTRFHALCHDLRDDGSAIQALIARGETEEYRHRYRRFHDDVAGRVAAYFQASLRDDGINCAIRLSDKLPDGSFVYTTRGRSSGMDPRRKDLTEAVGADEGIAWKLRKESNLGVCIIGDIEEAIRLNWWKRCRTDALQDVKAAFVAPINAVIDEQKYMVGILFITSRRQNLDERHVEMVKGFADLLGMLYPAVTGIFVRSG